MPVVHIFGGTVADEEDPIYFIVPVVLVRSTVASHCLSGGFGDGAYPGQPV